MNNYWIVAIASIGLAACASPGPEHPDTAAHADHSLHETDALAAENDAESTNVARATASPDIADENSVYCRKEKLTGTRISQVVCMTSAEKERIREISRMNVDSAKRSAGAVPQNN